MTVAHTSNNVFSKPSTSKNRFLEICRKIGFVMRWRRAAHAAFHANARILILYLLRSRRLFVKAKNANKLSTLYPKSYTYRLIWFRCVVSRLEKRP